MKKTITLLAGILVCTGLFAQVNSSQSYTKNLLKAVNNWKQIPKSVFPIGNVTVFEEVELKTFSQNKSVESEAIIPSGNNFWVLGIEKDMLTISMSEVSKLKGSVKIDETNFKQKVANLFELRKKQRKK